MKRAIIERFETDYPFLVATEDGKYEWGNKKEESVILSFKEARKVQKILAFETLLVKIYAPILSCFVTLPHANDPDIYPESNWATSYHCDVCGCADYDQIHKGDIKKGIMPFFKNSKTGDLVCETCANINV